MKKHQVISLFFIFIFPGITSQAQVRIFGGPQLTTAKYSIQNVKQPTNSKVGFMAGIGLTTAVEGPVYFSPSISYSRKGYKVVFNAISVPPDSAAVNDNTSINTLSIAPLLQVNLAKAESHFFIRVGPAIDIALSGKEVFDKVNGSVQQSMLFGSLGYSPVTASANVHLGFEHKNGFTLFAHYEHGLSSLNNADLGPMILQRVVGVALGLKL